MKLRLLPMLLFAVVPLSAQSTPAAPVYVESFRHGETHVVEDSLDVKLTPQDSTYREHLKDSYGNDRYVFTILPRIPEGDTEITSWQARLTDLRHPIYSNILMTSPQPSEDPKNAYKDTLWRLEPGGFAGRAGRRQAHHQSGWFLCGASGEGLSLYAARFAVSGFDDRSRPVHQY